MSRVALIRIALSAFFLFAVAHPALGQVEVVEILSAGVNLEPGAHTLMVDGPPTNLGDGAVAFSIKINDVDQQADDAGGIAINCFLVQNLGSATSTDITHVMVLDGTGTAVAAAVATAAPGGVPPAGCPTGAPVGGNILFEAFVAPASLFIADNGSETFQIAVLTAGTDVLLSGAQNKTVRLRVIVQYTESIGSPPAPANFTHTITDSDQDFISNSGINDLTLLNFTPVPIKIGTSGVVIRFRVCDRDANTHSLRLDEIALVQGPLGSALIDDFDKFEFWMISGVEQLWGQITSSDAGFTASFNRGGSGIILPVTAGMFIPDEQCREFEIRGTPSIGALKGRIVHLRTTLSTEEPTGTDINASVDRVLQSATTVMLGSGVVRVLDVQTPGGNVPIEVIGFASPGLGRIEIQTRSMQFDATVIKVEGVTPVAPYEVEDVQIDNRIGTLKFTLAIDDAQSPSAKMGIPAPETIAYIQITRKGTPGQRTPLIMQVDGIFDVNGVNLTAQVSVISGSVLLPLFGDVDQLGDGPTVKDVLLLASSLLSCFDEPPVIIGLTDSQKFIADVAPPMAAPGVVPDCTTLTSADLIPIAKAAIEPIASSALSQHSPAGESGSGVGLPIWLIWLQKLFPWLLNSIEPVQVELVATEFSGDYRLQIDSGSIRVSGIQGSIKFDAVTTRLLEIEALGEYQLLASEIDKVRGEIRFVVLASLGHGSLQKSILRVKTEAVNDSHGVALTADLRYLLNEKAEEIPFGMIKNTPETRSVSAFSVNAFRLSSQNGIFWTLRVEGQGIASVRVDAFDLSGHKHFAVETEGSTLRWSALDSFGKPLANGVYLFVVKAKGIAGEQWQSTIRKVVVLR